MEPEVIITVARDGEVNVEVKGVAGGACTKQSAPYIKALGTVTESKPTPEMFLPEQEQKNKVSY